MDQTRLYEVDAAGAAWTRDDPAALRRLHRLRWLFGIGVTANAVSWSLAAAAIWLGGVWWGAAFGVLALLTLPLLALPALIEAHAHWRAWRRNRVRSDRFPRL